MSLEDKNYIGVSAPIADVTGKSANIDAAYGPYVSIDSVISNILPALRVKGRTVGVISSTGGVDEYWWKDGIGDADLVLKTPDLSAYATIDQLDNYVTNETFTNQFNALDQRIQTNTNNYNTLSSTVNNHTDEIGDLNAKYTTLESTVNENTQKITNLENDKVTNTSQLTNDGDDGNSRFIREDELLTFIQENLGLYINEEGYLVSTNRINSASGFFKE